MTPPGRPRAAFAGVRYGSTVHPQHQRLLTRQELASIGQRRGPERAAGLIAVKHAALSLGATLLAQPPGWGDLVVRRRENAAQVVELAGRPMTWRVSVSHCDGLAVAALMIDGGDHDRR